MRGVLLAIASALCVAGAACGGDDESTPTTDGGPRDARTAPTDSPITPPDDAGTMMGDGSRPDSGATGETVVIAGAGDICGGCDVTADLLDAIGPDAVFTAGDNAYPDGTASDFMDGYDPYWGRFKSITYPSPGNHDYHVAGAADYYAYFGASAHGPDGYYSYDIGAWHVVVINSNCSEVGGCDPGSPQETWLRADLAASGAACTLAYWHHPRFSSGSTHGNSESMEPIWQALYDANADLVISGHEHNYERFAPQDPTGAADDARGIREFVVGTGGASHYAFGTPIPNSEIRNGDTFGVLELTLRADGYDWEFVAEPGHAFTDTGSSACH